MSNTNNIKKDFPLLQEAKVKHKPLVYLDSAATSQKPKQVIQAEKDWYEKYNANIHRGVYELAEQATMKYEIARAKAAKFIGAESNREIVFTRGATEGINLISEAWARHNLNRGDIILLTEMEHHANIVPWQKLAKEKGLKIKYWPIDENGELITLQPPLSGGQQKNNPPDKGDLGDLLKGVKFISLVHVSNTLGTINPVTQIIKQAHQKNIPILVDAAQSAPHLPINVRKMQPDFLAFSGHKMLGPTGIGVLYVKRERFAEMDVYQTGGDMIQSVTFKKSEYKTYPWKFEAGTQNLAGAIGLASAINYLQAIGMSVVSKHDQLLVNYTAKKLREIPEVTVYGPKTIKRCSVVSFTVEGIHAHDLASLLDEQGICIRAGHHCTMPLHEKLGVSATARASFYIYNDKQDADKFIKALQKIIKKWKQVM